MTKYLLDSHVWIWLLKYPSKLPKGVMKELRNPDVELFLSVASIWELAIKRSVRRAEIPDNLLSPLAANDVALLPVSAAHAEATAKLPLLHKDPFDRMLLVQTMMEKMRLITHDENLRQYNIPCLFI